MGFALPGPASVLTGLQVEALLTDRDMKYRQVDEVKLPVELPGSFPAIV